MQIARSLAVLLLSLGCVSVAFADEVPAPYDEDITSSDVVQMDQLQLATNDDVDNSYNNSPEYNNDNSYNNNEEDE